MSKSDRRLWLWLVLPCLILSCSEERKGSSPTKTTVFPTTVGSEWTYVYCQSLGRCDPGVDHSDTVIVAVSGETEFRDGRTATQWTVRNVNSARFWNRFGWTISCDSVWYVVEKGDSLEVYCHLDDTQPKQIILRSIDCDSRWENPNGQPVTVECLDSIETPAGKFAESYLLRTKYIGQDNYRTWIEPNVGIVRFELLPILVNPDVDPGSIMMDLISYSIAEP